MDNQSWEVVIEGDPNSQKRHRHRKAGRKIITYDPSARDKKVVEEIIGYQKPKKIFKGPIKVELIAWFRTPKSYSNKKTKKLENTYRPKKPDNDNIEKFYYDCMSDIVFEDDNQVVINQTEKRYSARPCVKIVVTKIGIHPLFDEIIE